MAAPMSGDRAMVISAFFCLFGRRQKAKLGHCWIADVRKGAIYRVTP